MRRIFLVGAQVLGVYVWLYTLQTLSRQLSQALSMSGANSTSVPLLAVEYWVAAAIVGALIGWFLICRSERIADALGISEDAHSVPLLPTAQFHRLVVVLLGVYILLTAAPRAAVGVAQVLLVPSEPYLHGYFFLETCARAIESLFGMLLIFRPGIITRRIHAPETPVPPPSSQNVPPPSSAAYNQHDETAGEDAGATASRKADS